jgi:hypothetical protein
MHNMRVFASTTSLKISPPGLGKLSRHFGDVVVTIFKGSLNTSLYTGGCGCLRNVGTTHPQETAKSSKTSLIHPPAEAFELI